MVAALKIGAAEAGVVGHWIDGKHVSGAGQRRAPVFNPALGEPVREVSFADRTQVDAAVQSALQLHQTARVDGNDNACARFFDRVDLSAGHRARNLGEFH